MRRERAGLWGLLAVVAAVVVPFAPRPAQAFQGFRCGSGRLVDEGDAPYEVQDRCGDPDSAEARQEERTVRRTTWTQVNGVPIAREEDVIITVAIEEWTYDLGPNKLIRHLIFEQNRLVKVWTGRRGTGR
jgi:hypothetical protein